MEPTETIVGSKWFTTAVLWECPIYTQQTLFLNVNYTEKSLVYWTCSTLTFIMNAVFFFIFSIHFRILYTSEIIGKKKTDTGIRKKQSSHPLPYNSYNSNFQVVFFFFFEANTTSILQRKRQVWALPGLGDEFIMREHSLSKSPWKPHF